MSSIIKVDTVQDQDGNNIINENANTITIGASGDTITIPSGATLANNGTATGFFEGIAWQSITTAATLTTVAGKGYPINTTSNACTVTLPSSASVGDQIQIVDYAGTFATNNITLTSSLNINGATDNKFLTTNREGVTITYVDVTQGWVATSGVNSGSQAIDPELYSADFLVVAGGAGGGWDAGGGGGAGGYRNSYSTETSGGGGSSETSLEFLPGTVYTITVGSGGAGATSGSVIGSSGLDSLISGTGITTITSTGGGGGGSLAPASTINNGVGGGSGGGGCGYNRSTTGGSGTTNQGFAGGDNTVNTTSATGGAGGGAGGGGGGAISNASGFSTRGLGLASSITGSSVTRAEGGRGGGDATTGTVDGGANTGTGGDGAGVNTGNAGGSGVVILSMPLAKFSGTTTGSPTESDDGTTKRLVFNASGSYTA